jgi:predicted KAP-like P-loop ATPase
MVHEKLNIFSDKALGSIDQDKFNRTGFVKVLVRAIRESCSQHGSTVLALLGPWGCGKTSIKNLAVKELEKGPTDPRVMEFCPWQVSGTGKITTLFFEALIGQISKENEVPDADSKRKSLRLYASLLSKGSKFVEVVANAISHAAPTSDVNAVGGAAVAHGLSGSIKIGSDILAELGKELPEATNR